MKREKKVVVSGYRVKWRGGSEDFSQGPGGYVLLSDANTRAQEYAGKMRLRGLAACVEPLHLTVEV